MPRTYHIIGTGDSGARESIKVLAATPGEAEARANEMGLVVTSLREVPAWHILPPPPWSAGLAGGVLVVGVVMLVIAALLAGDALQNLGPRQREHAKLKQVYDGATGIGGSLNRDGVVFVPNTHPGGRHSFRTVNNVKSDLDAAATALGLTYAQFAAAAVLALLGGVLAVICFAHRAHGAPAQRPPPLPDHPPRF